MGLNPRGRGRGRGGKSNFPDKSWEQTGMMNHGAIFTSGPNTTLYPCPFGAPSGFNINPLKLPHMKYYPGNGSGKQTAKGNDLQLVGTEMTKSNFNEDLKKENNKKRFFGAMRKTRYNEKWNKSKVLNREKISAVRNHYCETCDRSFRTQEDLLLHKAEHETCNHDGCEFTAHPKIIAKHIKMQHESGLYKRMGKLNTEEDIAKWIEERKKRYPTRKVIEDKKILEEEKTNRGERIKDDNSKFNKSFNKRNKKGWKKNFIKQTHKNTKNRKRRKKETSLIQKHLEEEKKEDFRKGVPAFSGIRDNGEEEVPEKNESFISDEEWETEHVTPNASKAFLNSSLGLLAELYNSDEDEEPPSQESQNVVVKENNSTDEESGPEEVKTVSIKKTLSEEKSNEKKVPVKRKFLDKKEMTNYKRRNTYNQSNLESRSATLLEKLLKNEIRHERNVILQCIHYIVNNNFFKT